MPTLPELITTIYKRGGLPADNATLTAITSNEELKKINIPDVESNTLLTNLMNVEQAKENGTIISHFRAVHLNPVDEILSPLMDELGDDATDLKAEKSTYKKLPEIVARLRKLESKKAGASAPEKKLLQDEIEKLNAQVVQINKSWSEKEATLKSTHDAELTDMMLGSKLNGYKYGIGVDQNVASITAKALLQQELSAKGLKLKRDGNIFKLVDGSTGIEYKENNENVPFDKFADRVVSPLLEKTDPNRQQQQQYYQPQNNGQQNNGQQNGKNIDTSDIDKAILHLTASKPVSI